MSKKNRVRITFIFIIICLLSNLFFFLANTKYFYSYLSEYKDIFDLVLHEKADFFSCEYFSSNELYEKIELNDADGIQTIINKIHLRNPFIGKIDIVEKNFPFNVEKYYITIEFNNLYLYYKIYNFEHSSIPNTFVKIDFDEKDLLDRLQHNRKIFISYSEESYDFIYGIKVEPIESMLPLYEVFISVFLGLFCSFAYYFISKQTESFFYNKKGINKIIFLFERTEEFSANHSRNVAEIAHFLGRKYGLKGKKLNDLKVAAYLHDIGKISIPVEILNKPETLNKDEFGVIKKHVVFSAEIIENFEELKHLREIILYHHEKMDGSGYPEGLDGEAIPLGSRIIAVADIYEALVGKRPYRDSFSMDKALFTMRNMPLDRKVFDLLIEFRYEVNALITNSKDEKEPKKSVI